MGLRFASPEMIPNYEIHIGNLKIHEGDGLGVDEIAIAENAIFATYPGGQDRVLLNVDRNELSGALVFDVYSIDGKKVLSDVIAEGQSKYELQTHSLNGGIYLVQFRSNSEGIKTLKIRVR